MSLKIIPVFCNEKNMANYAYILHDKEADITIIIDAAESAPIIRKLDELNLKPTHILTTHHHFDHVEGNLDLKQKYNLQIIAPEKEFDNIPGADIKAANNIPITIKSVIINPIEAPGHTNGHILYHLQKEKLLFTGDVLFNLCIGGLFEGTPQQMFDSLQKIKKLPDDTLVFPGHEYTRSCLPGIVPHDSTFQTYIQKMLKRENGELAPATLHEEKTFNPYLQAKSLAEFM